MSAVAASQLDGCPIAVTGGHDGTLRVWDLAGVQLLGIDLGSRVWDVAVRGGQIVVRASGGGVSIKLNRIAAPA